jgi:uncharacterized protein YbjT (DUF2867 family)
MHKVLVTGGTGHLGRDIVRLLKERGDMVRVLARTPGQDPDVEWIRGDLSTGVGIPEALAGTHTVVHAATLSPAAQRGYLRMGDFIRSPSEVDLGGTRRLLDAAARAGAQHFLYVSIVGVQQSRFPYSRLKAAAEDLVRAGTVPWSIVPATGFYWLLARMLDTMAGRRIWPLPSKLAMQPGDSADFAKYVVESVADGPTGERIGFGGPETLTLVELARQYQAARGISRRIVAMPLPGYVLSAAGPQTCPDGRHGATTWAEWLSRRT